MITREQPPEEIRGPSAWYGPALAARTDWIEVLSDTELLEIDKAAERLVRFGFDIPSMRRHDFPLPTLGPRLRRLLDELLTGRGFVLLRRLPVEKWSRHKAATAYFGLGTHLGNARSQNAQGHVLGHVRDLGQSSSDPNVRIYQTKERQGYHTDSSDLVGLLCLQTAKEGGAFELGELGDDLQRDAQATTRPVALSF